MYWLKLKQGLKKTEKEGKQNENNKVGTKVEEKNSLMNKNNNYTEIFCEGFSISEKSKC